MWGRARSWRLGTLEVFVKPLMDQWFPEPIVPSYIRHQGQSRAHNSCAIRSHIPRVPGVSKYLIKRT